MVVMVPPCLQLVTRSSPDISEQHGTTYVSTGLVLRAMQHFLRPQPASVATQASHSRDLPVRKCWCQKLSAGLASALGNPSSSPRWSRKAAWPIMASGINKTAPRQLKKVCV